MERLADKGQVMDSAGTTGRLPISEEKFQDQVAHGSRSRDGFVTTAFIC